MDKLIKAKAIMDVTDNTPKTNKKYSLPKPNFDEYDTQNVKYNIPQEFLAEQPVVSEPYLSRVPNTKPVGVPTVDAIKNSKLPDEIKKLMIEHPIAQAQQPQTTLSNELIEKASRLMNNNNSNNYMPESADPKPKKQVSENIDYNIIKKMIEEAVNNALKQNGLLVESSEKSNEIFSFKVGKHLFEGKITKIKKMI